MGRISEEYSGGSPQFEFEKKMSKWNPFYSMYRFTAFDLEREPLGAWDRLKISVRRCYHAFGDDGVYHYKMIGPKVYLIKWVSHDGKTTKWPGKHE